MSIALAQRYRTAIVSADSRQIYRELPIGTAAPTADELAAAKHYFVGTHELDAYFSAAEFEAEALKALEEIWRQSPVAVVCGGSQMYIDALVNGIDDMPTVSASTRAYVLSMLEAHGLEGVLAQLQVCDPDYYEEVDRANTRRVVHAVEISLEAGRPYSTFRTGKKRQRPFDVLKMAIELPREELFARINARVDAMIASGLEEEAANARAKGDFNSLNTIGYKELRAVAEGLMNRETAIARIAKNTRVYAKKQLTWLRRDPSVQWIHSLDEAIALIDNKIDQL